LLLFAANAFLDKPGKRLTIIKFIFGWGFARNTAGTDYDVPSAQKAMGWNGKISKPKLLRQSLELHPPPSFIVTNAQCRFPRANYHNVML